jgi:exodeoxyribonuclease V alpha subunit
LRGARTRRATLRDVSSQERLPLPSGAAPPGDEGPTATIAGVLERVAFANEENAWSVVKIAVPGRREPVTAVGSLLGVQPGESLTLQGKWVHDKRFGDQFQVTSYRSRVPVTVEGIERYLGSGMLRGIGKVMAERLVARFGAATLDVIDEHPERLTEVEGIGKVRSQQIRGAWLEQRAIRDVMVFLQAHGVSTSHAVKIYKRYHDAAIGLVRQNPYRLANDIDGIGFQTADHIAQRLGLAPTSDERCRAGVLHVLQLLSEDGHVGATRRDVVQRTNALLDVANTLVDRAVDALAVNGDVILETIEGGTAVYGRALYGAEAELATRMLQLIATPTKPLELDIARAVAWYEAQRAMTLAVEQRQAIALAARAKVLVGTGKTTLINGIIQILEKKGRVVRLAAPTGRAAKRMSETTAGHEAKTLHRLLDWSPRTQAFERGVDRPLEADVVIVDEASMLDTVMACALLRALPAAAQLILVGDVDQLPSVGPGMVLEDVIRSGAAVVVRLSQIFRQAEASRIVVNAHRVNQGLMPIVANDDPHTDFFFIERDDPEAIVATIKALIRERIARRFGLDPIRDIQVLTPMHKGQLGAANLNAELQQALNPEGQSVSRGARLFRLSDKVMQVRNNYDLEVYNGDIGVVTRIQEGDRSMAVSFDGREVLYEEANLDELVLAYACSIHKAQGSEYPCVVVPLHTQHFVMLRRNLLYTAITRGRRLVVIVGSQRALATAVKTDDTSARFTGLARRLGPRSPPAELSAR